MPHNGNIVGGQSVLLSLCGVPCKLRVCMGGENKWYPEGMGQLPWHLPVCRPLDLGPFHSKILVAPLAMNHGIGTQKPLYFS